MLHTVSYSNNRSSANLKGKQHARKDRQGIGLAEQITSQTQCSESFNILHLEKD